MKTWIMSAVILALALAESQARADETDGPGFNPRLLRRFKPVRAEIESGGNPVTNDKIDLGRMLYFDRRLSKDKEVSCNSCHPLDKYGADGEKTSKGEKGQRGRRNAPTVYHAAAAFVQFWDGRAGDVEEQAKGPILNPVEMGMPGPAQVVERLNAIPGYVAAFKKAFPGETNALSYDNVGRAIAAFERRLVTPSRWDRYLEGQTNALTAQEVEGLRTFTNIGCMVCHTGELLGGSMYQRVGAVQAWPNQSDRGRAENTKQNSDDMYFKVPTLRNVAMTGPYFHDGSVATLPEAVRMMARHQLGVELEADEVSSIVAWLGSLTGPLPAEYIKAPKLPPDGAKAN